LGKPFIVGSVSGRFSAGIRRRFTAVVRYLSIAVSRTVILQNLAGIGELLVSRDMRERAKLEGAIGGRKSSRKNPGRLVSRFCVTLKSWSQRSLNCGTEQFQKSSLGVRGPFKDGCVPAL
jgi:hypothetical protein